MLLLLSPFFIISLCSYLIAIALHSPILEAMSESVEALLREAGVEYDPVVVQAANAIWDGRLSSLSLELDEHGDLLINSDDLVKTEVVDISEGEENEELFDTNQNLEVKEETFDYFEGGDQVENDEVGGDEWRGGEEDGEKDEGEGEHDEGEGEHEVLDINFRRCGLCGEVKHKKSILRHIKLIHENVKVICGECGLQLNSEAKLQSHIAKVHGENEEEEAECSFCGKKFSGRAKASYHETTVHKGQVENEFKCTVCPKSYKTKPNLSRHMRDKHMN